MIQLFPNVQPENNSSLNQIQVSIVDSLDRYFPVQVLKLRCPMVELWLTRYQLSILLLLDDYQLNPLSKLKNVGFFILLILGL